MPHGQKIDIKQKQYCHKFNKDFKNGPSQKNLQKNKKEKRMKDQMVNILGFAGLWTLSIQVCSNNTKAAIDDTETRQPGYIATEHFSMDTKFESRKTYTCHKI